MLTVYPNEYLGRAAVNNSGVAQLKVYQSPGEYTGGAIWVRTPQGKVFSNIVRYKVNALGLPVAEGGILPAELLKLQLALDC